MGKGDKKSRRGKIIIGSTGVRRPKPSKRKATVKVVAPVEVVEKVKKVTEKAKVEPKPKAKISELAVETETELTVAHEKPVKKAVKRTKAEDAAE
jgi:30S ribosomal protein S31